MRAGSHNFICEQGATFKRTVEIEQPDLDTDPTGNTFAPYDLTGFTARMQVRRTIDSSNFLLELTTENGCLEINPASPTNVISINVPDEVTASVDTSGIYDLEIENESGEVSRVLQGNFTVVPQVTR
jgi:hypothetical protein